MTARSLPPRDEGAARAGGRQTSPSRTGVLAFSPRRIPATDSGVRALPRKRPILLLADREPAVLLAACRYLEKVGFDVRRASTATETSALFSTVRPDLVVLDGALPDGDGFELCEALRKTAAGQETPFVIATDSEDYESVRRSHDAGASDFVLRPINWWILSRRLWNLIEADRARRHLHVSKALLREAEEVACLASWNHDVSTGGIEWSPEAAYLLGLEEPVDGRPESFLALVHPDDRPFVEAEILSAARDRRPFGAEHRIRRPKDGAVRFIRHWADYSMDGNGETRWLRGIVQDVTEQMRAEEQIWQLSNVDGLTGLPNRTMLQQLLGHALAQGARANRLVATLFLDIDRFAEINESYGPSEGDQLIVDVAGRLQQVLRRGDMVAHSSPFEEAQSLARLSGDEFVVLLTDVEKAEDAARVAQRILDALAGTYQAGPGEIFVTASIGIALSPQDGSEPGLLIQHAQTALTEAKKKGRGTYRFYGDTLNGEVAARLGMESGLHRALERGELSLHYQPLVDGKTREVTGFEALLRWTSPSLGAIPPVKFIPVAEESGLILRFGDWVLRTACRQAAAWALEGLGPLDVAVNVSTLQLRQSGFPWVVRDALRQSGLSPERLCLEITESALLAHDDVTVACLTELKKIGIRLVIDDFGTGYSALRYLKNFPVDALKIDRSFVEGIATSAGDTAIVSALVAMSRGLGITVVAEGVETEEQFRYLQSLECDQAQGFLFSRPLPAEAFGRMLRSMQRPRAEEKAV
jgi:diguanylate cyclase (GGDEF)-like protein/PAS domain S-box-containing protein